MGRMGCKSLQMAGNTRNCNPLGVRHPLRKLGEQLMFLWGTESSSKAGLPYGTYLLFPLQQNIFLPDNSRTLFHKALGNMSCHKTLNWSYVKCWGKLRGSSLGSCLLRLQPCVFKHSQTSYLIISFSHADIKDFG